MSKQLYELQAQRHRIKVVRRRVTVMIGLCFLLLGYILLAVNPDTASEWVLIRVVIGFVFIFVGFVVAVLPILTRLTGGDD
ncbi:MAG: hypothetical protein A2535_13970 [Burkholderiales bacterium RIFOXYD2_FULL_59_8]|nr:MAG: hypothetical protein A2535_13970 [Burkholderiales bacterium RIFOXYD2_FULL_59_8]